ncbi:MAG: hypothetical protein A2Y89_05210 [Chloroflexi bacterium RBG_13_51_18]|nr:MAG: hypothetical protein A2Y89_05210 [Chloroflexi bacterium RBG_13_51_18]
MSKNQKRKRGGQPGNQNAVKHGYYSRTFNPADRFDLDLAAGIEGIDAEIALLRFEIKKAVTGGNIDHLVPLVKATVALEKLIRTHHKIYGGRRDDLKNALKNTVRDIMLPLDPSGKFALTAVRNWANYSSVDINEAERKTNNAGIEPDLTYNENQIIVANRS